MNVTKEGDLSARPLTSSSTIKFFLSTYSPLSCFSCFFSCYNFLFLYFFLVKIFWVIKCFFKIKFILRILKISYSFKRIYFGFPLLGELDFWNPVDFSVFSKCRVMTHFVNKCHFSTSCATQDQNISQNLSIIQLSLRISNAEETK